MRVTTGLAFRNRAEALAQGFWCQANGLTVRLADLHPAHLVNALLAALAAEEPTDVTRPLAAEVARRGLEELAREVALRRSGTQPSNVAQFRASKRDAESQNSAQTSRSTDDESGMNAESGRKARVLPMARRVQ